MIDGEGCRGDLGVRDVMHVTWGGRRHNQCFIEDCGNVGVWTFNMVTVTVGTE